MDAAIEKILSKDVNTDDYELPDFEEGSSDSKDINEDEISSEEDKEVGEEDSKPELSGEDSDDESDLDADLAGDVEAVSVGTSSAGSSGDDGEGKIAKVGTKRKGFLEGGKDDTLARAFARIVDSPADMIGDGAPILAGSKSIARRQEEEEEQAKIDRVAKKLRIEMRQRGHVLPALRGSDPAVDFKEKVLQKTATRGVVRLFNAIATSQRRLRETEDATGSKAKAARLGKASFLAELRNSRTLTGEALVPSSKDAPQGGGAFDALGGDNSHGEVNDEGTGWEVLQKGFNGLQGGSKMKDWDKKQESDAESSEGRVADDSGSSDDGW